MKRLLLILCISAAVIYGCKKDSGTNVNVNSSDVAVINSQLKGTWLFPIDNQTITDISGAVLSNNGYVAAPALEFNGGSGVTIINNLQVRTTGTYQLSTKNGLIYLDITDSKGNDVTYQVLQINNLTLKLVSKAPYTYYNNGTPEPAETVSNITLQKQSSADVTGGFVTVEVISNVAYNVNVFVTHTKGADTAVLLDSKQNVNGIYTFAFPAKTGDQLNADVAGDYSQSAFYVYYNGIPMTGSLSVPGGQEFKTTTGWVVP
ncbi:MAG: hypothetical protein JSU01_06650 [Bacteroidetes bacterium]|nr:hypothetical protein [Bacteroidota bacterium]